MQATSDAAVADEFSPYVKPDGTISVSNVERVLFGAHAVHGINEFRSPIAAILLFSGERAYPYYA